MMLKVFVVHLLPRNLELAEQRFKQNKIYLNS